MTGAAFFLAGLALGVAVGIWYADWRWVHQQADDVIDLVQQLAAKRRRTV